MNVPMYYRCLSEPYYVHDIDDKKIRQARMEISPGRGGNGCDKAAADLADTCGCGSMRESNSSPDPFKIEIAPLPA